MLTNSLAMRQIQWTKKNPPIAAPVTNKDKKDIPLVAAKGDDELMSQEQDQKK